MSAEEIIVFKGSGGGFADSAFANWIYAQPRQTVCARNGISNKLLPSF